ncbi:tetratricopeptide repeat protein [Aquiflexum sp. TKW24L]|uniref:tetratricopeptide repeat protein n=1 Tax=Aquiflexum sp. TKW24L TaxID=2942212 RepID=UPI0020BED30D|nr:tetratricopeptide repeat protein [Aquiflexum sp. TKW24L]MCL6259101.1 tetratricopeptide repeat protein [Aquiflexum sp. TKW24L]
MKGLPISLSVIGGLFLLFSSFFWERGIMPVLPGIFSEAVSVPVKLVQVGGELVKIEMDNFLLFQNFESLPALTFPNLSLLFGGLVWLLFSLGLALISTLKKLYFTAATALVIFLLAFSGINGLNIGGISTNYPLIGLMAGILIPLIGLSFFATSWGILGRFFVILFSGSATLYLLTVVSDIPSPWLWLGENSAFPAAVISVIFLLHIGHAFISGSSILLIKLNKGTGIKITWHILFIFLIYFFLVFFSFLDITGEVDLPFPILPPVILMLIGGLIGYFVLQYKIQQTDQVYKHSDIGKSFFWIGYALTTFTWGWVIFKDNQPMIEFFNHIFIYGQVAFSLLFYLYLMANFSEILNSGKDLEKIIFKPQFFAYFHMRIGAIMAVVVLVIYADGIIGVQLASGSSNINAEYYYQTDRPLEAAILFESSWIQYRKNDKAKNTASHLRFSLNQTNLGMENLYQVFDNSPSVINTLLLSSKLHEQEKIFDAVFYLERGLSYFPDNPYLANNLSLLYSKLNKPTEAISMMEKITDQNPVLQSNLLALKVKHQVEQEEVTSIPEDQIFKINYLVFENKKGNFAPFILSTDNLPENYSLKTALLRNQWTNKVTAPLASDLPIIDSLVAKAQVSIEEMNLRDTRILRTLQESYINESLKYLNGTAMALPNAAGYYHSISAKILYGELDFEKSSVDILVAEERGFQNFQPIHLAILHFGGKPEEAQFIHQKFNVPFPDWMVWDENGELVENSKTAYFDKSAKLHRAMPSDFMKNLEEIQDLNFQAEYAFKILLHKMHWLDDSEFSKVKNILLQNLGDVWSSEDLDSWYSFVTKEEKTELTEKTQALIKQDLDLGRNAYWVPLVLKKVNAETDDLKKYEILQDAIQFSKDPMLWIQYVKQSRKLGLDSYASNALVEMQGWLTISQIEKLQLANL